MKKLLCLLCLAACGANAPAIKAAEKACLKADETSLQAKLTAGISDPEATAISLTEGEVICALEALGATAGSAAP
jgi:hypothetical protein